MSELKPCPFCGGKLKIERNNNYWWVNCFKCSYISDYIHTEEQALELVNNRPVEDALATENAALKARLAELEEEKVQLNDIIEHSELGEFVDYNITLQEEKIKLGADNARMREALEFVRDFEGHDLDSESHKAIDKALKGGE
ncbi:MAG: Lar family restriction alleviation protein [Deferribacterales bacterium]